MSPGVRSSVEHHNEAFICLFPMSRCHARNIIALLAGLVQIGAIHFFGWAMGGGGAGQFSGYDFSLFSLGF